MSMVKWAQDEVDLVLKNGKYDEYMKMCCQSALKAYKTLCEDDHSGSSFSVASNILQRLCCGNPLTPVEDVEDQWVFTHKIAGISSYQHRRLFSLFKDVDEEGNIKYYDNNRAVCIYPHERGTWSNKWATRAVDELYPITMPYFPPAEPFYVYCDKYMEKNGSGNEILHIKHIKVPNTEGEPDITQISRYFLMGDRGESKELNKSQIEEFNRRKDTEWVLVKD